jgi:hypothetical protein
MFISFPHTMRAGKNPWGSWWSWMNRYWALSGQGECRETHTLRWTAIAHNYVDTKRSETDSRGLKCYIHIRTRPAPRAPQTAAIRFPQLQKPWYVNEEHKVYFENIHWSFFLPWNWPEHQVRKHCQIDIHESNKNVFMIHTFKFPWPTLKDRCLHLWCSKLHNIKKYINS